MTAGVTLADPARIDVRGTLDCGSDVFIDVGCVFEGAVKLGDKVRIGPTVCCVTSIGAGSVVHPMSHLEGCTAGEGVLIGPFARLRPGAALGDEVHIGNFVSEKLNAGERHARPIISLISATPRSASASTTVPGRSPPTTTAPASTAR
jgi:bifunctional UDP-N-acetylglucosamine pyrophosphorylase/glucosamine-1-phosphate N-acetyltransferase